LTAFAHHYPDCEPAGGVVDRDSFITFLECAQATELDHFRRVGVTATEFDQLLAVHVWIADKEQAVLSIQAPSAVLSYGVYTSDPKFVDVLVEMTGLFGL